MAKSVSSRPARQGITRKSRSKPFSVGEQRQCRLGNCTLPCFADETIRDIPESFDGLPSRSQRAEIPASHYRAYPHPVYQVARMCRFHTIDFDIMRETSEKIQACLLSVKITTDCEQHLLPHCEIEPTSFGQSNF